MRNFLASVTKARYCTACCSTEILRRSTFWVRASINSRSSGPSNPSILTFSISASTTA